MENKNNDDSNSESDGTNSHKDDYDRIGNKSSNKHNSEVKICLRYPLHHIRTRRTLEKIEDD